MKKSQLIVYFITMAISIWKLAASRLINPKNRHRTFFSLSLNTNRTIKNDSRRLALYACKKRASTFRGVTSRSGGRWNASITSSGIRKVIGCYDCESDAARAYDEAALALRGSSAKLNFPRDRTNHTENENNGSKTEEKFTPIEESYDLESFERADCMDNKLSEKYTWNINDTIDEDMEVANHIENVLFGSQLDPYWGRELRKVDRPSARSLIPLLVPDNLLGYMPAFGTRPGSLFEYVLLQKALHPTKVLLIRVGEFFETYGVDSVLLVQYCGLNPMGGKPKAGCPIRNVQQTLNGLTQAGLSVAVYEELNDADVLGDGGRFGRIKRRILAQVVTPGSPTYFYDACLRSDDLNFPESRPYLGVSLLAGGFTLVEVYADARSICMSERLTEEALKAAIDSGGAVEPLFVGVGNGSTQEKSMWWTASYLPDHKVKVPYSEGSEGFTRAILNRVGALLELSVEDMQRFTIARFDRSELTGRPRPVYVSTALQIGLLRNPNVPDLIPRLLPNGYPQHCSRYLQRWLLRPPPPNLADAMANLCYAFSTLHVALPKFRPISVGKAVSLLTAKQCNVALFRDIDICVKAVLTILGQETDAENPYAELVSPLLLLVTYQSSVNTSASRLRSDGFSVINAIAEVIAHTDTCESSISADSHGIIPAAFFEKNEGPFRDYISPQFKQMKGIFSAIDETSKHLCDVIKEDFSGALGEITYDMINNGLFLKKAPREVSEILNRDQIFVHPYDRNGKILRNRFTTERVKNATSAYVDAVEKGIIGARRALRDLSETLLGYLPSIVHCVHWSVIAQTVEGHTRHSRIRGWTLPILLPTTETRMEMKVEGLVPYWLGSDSVANSFTLDGIFLLTAPNMSGKSTLMRATMVAALLGGSGLFVPAKKATVPRFDSFFLRTSSFDIPVEGKSAWALEMDDVRVLLRDCTSRSLVMVDELGKGTSSRDGASIGGAILETLDSISLTGIFSTHLHELFDLPLKTKTVSHKRMGIDWTDDMNPRWTYKLEDGVCTDSLALHTAKEYGISETILQRAEELGKKFDENCMTRSSNSIGAISQSGTSLNLGAKKTDILTLKNAVDVFAKVVGCEIRDILILDAGYDVPLRLEGTSTVYVLYLKTGRYYIGESDAIQSRIKRHRSVFGNDIQILAVSVANKSAARAIESNMIKAFEKCGFCLESRGDASHVHFGVESNHINKSLQ